MNPLSSVIAILASTIPAAIGEEQLQSKIQNVLGPNWEVTTLENEAVRIQGKKPMRFYRPADEIGQLEPTERKTRLDFIIFTLRFEPSSPGAFDDLWNHRSARLLSTVDDLEKKLPNFRRHKGPYRPPSKEAEATYKKYIGILKGNSVKIPPISKTKYGDLYFSSNLGEKRFDGWTLSETSDKFLFWGAIFNAIAMAVPEDDYTVSTRDIADLVAGSHPSRDYMAKRRKALKIKDIEPIVLGGSIPKEELFPDDGG